MKVQMSNLVLTMVAALVLLNGCAYYQLDEETAHTRKLLQEKSHQVDKEQKLTTEINDEMMQLNRDIAAYQRDLVILDQRLKSAQADKAATLRHKQNLEKKVADLQKVQSGMDKIKRETETGKAGDDPITRARLEELRLKRERLQKEIDGLSGG